MSCRHTGCSHAQAAKIVWVDSPLVRAAKTGRTVVIDEADKAPLEVTWRAYRDGVVICIV